MTVPTVTELPMTLSAIEHDPFVDTLETTTVASAEAHEADAAKQTPPGRKSTRRRENVQTHMKKEHAA
jgi:hypothetical protein